MLGIVSRSDLVRAMATMISPAAGSIEGRLALFFRRHDAEGYPTCRRNRFGAAPPLRRRIRAPVTADEFRNLVTVSKQIERDDA